MYHIVASPCRWEDNIRMDHSEIVWSEPELTGSQSVRLDIESLWGS